MFRRLFVVGLLMTLGAGGTAVRYANDFEKAEVGKVPADLTVLDGTFTVRKVEGGKKCLELAGDPIGSYGVLFGPEDKAPQDVYARIWSESTGRRCPEFGIGVDGAGGYKLILAPTRGGLELRKGEDMRATSKMSWRSGTWTSFRLRAGPADQGGGWRVEGKAWSTGQPEPAEWQVAVTDGRAPDPGKASIWGAAISEKPIRFDDLIVR